MKELLSYFRIFGALSEEVKLSNCLQITVRTQPVSVSVYVSRLCWSLYEFEPLILHASLCLQSTSIKCGIINVDSAVEARPRVDCCVFTH